MSSNSLPNLTHPDPSSRLACVVDVETTGLDPSRHEVIELAAVLFAFDAKSGSISGIVEEYLGMREPTRPIPRTATAVHGITDDMVRGKQLNLHKVYSILRRADFVIAHNAPFDRAFLERLFRNSMGKTWLCSMTRIPWLAKGLSSVRLDYLCEAFDIEHDQRHRALSDARATLMLLAQPGKNRTSLFGELVWGAKAPQKGIP